MIRTKFNMEDHATIKIKESFIKEFVSDNSLEKVDGVGSKQIYYVDGVPTHLGAYSNSFEIRQFSTPAEQVICFNKAENEWRIFSPLDVYISRRGSSRLDLNGNAGYNIKFNNKQGVIL